MQKLNVANKFGAGLLFDSAGSHIGSDIADLETFDIERSKSKIVHGCDGFGHQPSIPIWFGDPKSAIALWVVRPGAKMNVSYGLAITRLRYQSPLINFFTRGNFFQLLLDKGLRAIRGIRPRHSRSEVPDDVPIIKLALDCRCVPKRKWPQN
jgi:hypothetical protein